jgi:hypothetical protein
LFFCRSDLFLRIKSSLFDCISYTSLWYWAKAPSSLDCNKAECFLALLSSFSNVSAQSTVSLYPWSMSDFCRDLSTTSCTRQQSLSSTQPCGIRLLKVLQRTFFHCSARRIDSRLRATVAGSTRSSASSSSPSRLVVAALDIGAERIGSASWISGDRTTTSMLDSGSASSCTSSVISGAIGTSGPEAAPPNTSASCTTPSIAIASGITVPSTCTSITTKHTKSVYGGYDYYTGRTTSPRCPYLPLW